MLWVPRWTAAGYTPDQAADLLNAGIGVDEATRHWPTADHDRNLPGSGSLRHSAAARTEVGPSDFDATCRSRQVTCRSADIST
jgi:hypothetical protein